MYRWTDNPTRTMIFGLLAFIFALGCILGAIGIALDAREKAIKVPS